MEPAMPRTIPARLFVLLAVSTATSLAGASDWRHWRGPTGNGVSPDGEPPTEWSTTRNLRWKTAIPGSGTASPIVVGEQIFVLTSLEIVATNSVGESVDATPAIAGRDLFIRGQRHLFAFANAETLR